MLVLVARIDADARPLTRSETNSASERTALSAPSVVTTL
jgi:hypothetical protein